MDPGPVVLAVPPELQGLSQVEEMLISAVMPIMTVYRLPHGQLGYNGHVVNLPQDVGAFVATLPRLVHELDVLVVRREGVSGVHKDFKVRHARVLSALRWLKANNVYYRNITISDSALEQLPQHGDVTTLPSVDIQDSSSDIAEHASTSEDPYDEDLSQTFVPMRPRIGTEQEVLTQGIADRQNVSLSCHQQPLPWPNIANTPINEFSTEGYMTCAFPVLFPTGAADFSAPRPRTVTIGYYFKHLLMYRDGRFARHPRFRYFALNTEMRHRALGAGQIYVKQNTTDAQLTVQELRDMVSVGGEAFSRRVLHYATSLRGTRSYWFKQRSRLISMIDTLGLPNVFFLLTVLLTCSGQN